MPNRNNAMPRVMQIRPLDASEWSKFREFRLNALKSTPGVFATAYAEAAARTEADWRALLAPERQQIFGLFDNGKLVGIAAAFTSRDDATTATLVMLFILPEYRGQKLSRRLFDTTLDWIRRRTTFRRVVVGHRASNIAPQDAIRAAR